MEHMVESLIGGYLTLCGNVFIAPQFHTVPDPDLVRDAPCPDYVAIDYKNNEVIVVEVSTASDLTRCYIPNIIVRRTRWYDPITELLLIRQILPKNDEKWKPRFLGFIRSDNILSCEKKFSSERDDDVSFYPIEDAILSYRYWNDRRRDGLPRGKHVPKRSLTAFA